MKVLAFGEILWDIIEGSSHIGGAPLNFAAHSVKSGAKGSIISCLGSDDLGLEAKRIVAGLGVGTDHIGIDSDHPTGTVEVFLSEGQPDYLIVENVAYDFITKDLIPDSAAEFDIFYFGTVVQRSETTQQTLYKLLDTRSCALRFYDVNLRKSCYSAETIKKSFEYANVIKLNDEEVAEVSKLVFNQELEMNDFVRNCHKRYQPEIVLITAGEDGCYVFWHDELHHIEGEKVIVKDAIGAGDAFSAAFMYNYFHSHDAVLAASVANKIGAYVASQEGAIPDYPEDFKKIL